MPDIEAFKDLARGLVIGKLPLALTDIISIHLYMDSVFVRKVQGKEHMRMCMRAHARVHVHVRTVVGRVYPMYVRVCRYMHVRMVVH